MENRKKIVVNPTAKDLIISFAIILGDIKAEHNIEDLKKKNASLL